MFKKLVFKTPCLWDWAGRLAVRACVHGAGWQARAERAARLQLLNEAGVEWNEEEARRRSSSLDGMLTRTDTQPRASSGAIFEPCRMQIVIVLARIRHAFAHICLEKADVLSMYLPIGYTYYAI